MKQRGKGRTFFPVKSQQVSFESKYCRCEYGRSKVCPQRQAGYRGDEVLNEIISCDILILKAGRQKEICNKIKVRLS